MTHNPSERASVFDDFLGARIAEGRGDRIALRTELRNWTYADVHALALRFGSVLASAGLEPEQRVLLALSDGADFVGAFFGTLAVGGVVVMVNPELSQDELRYFLEYTRAKIVVTGAESRPAFEAAARAAGRDPVLLESGSPDLVHRLAAAKTDVPVFRAHPDDAAIWLFSGGTTGKPKAVVQTHRSFVNTTELYAKNVLGFREDDITLSVPKLFFGYATGTNLLFPFAVGASAVLFPERCTPETLFEKIARFRPTILVNVPTMVRKMLDHPSAAAQDFTCLRLATSAGEALPQELHRRWSSLWNVDLLDGLGTAEMWHIFLTNRPGSARPGTLGQVVPGFDVRVRDDEGRDLPDGETGWLWVRGDSRAIGYWQAMDKTREAFRGAWYVSGDMIRRDADGFFTYCGRGDDMLKVSGKWLAPAEVEDRLSQHRSVADVCVVGVPDGDGLTKPWAFVVARAPEADFEERLRAFAAETLAAYKVPRRIVVMDALPRTHLGKADRGALRAMVSERTSGSTA